MLHGAFLIQPSQKLNQWKCVCYHPILQIRKLRHQDYTCGPGLMSYIISHPYN